MEGGWQKTRRVSSLLLFLRLGGSLCRGLGRRLSGSLGRSNGSGMLVGNRKPIVLGRQLPVRKHQLMQAVQRGRFLDVRGTGLHLQVGNHGFRIVFSGFHGSRHGGILQELGHIRHVQVGV